RLPPGACLHRCSCPREITVPARGPPARALIARYTAVPRSSTPSGNRRPSSVAHVMGATASLSPASVTVEPGRSATCTLRVRNTGTVVDQLTLDVLGDAAAWATVSPPTLSLFPGADG